MQRDTTKDRIARPKVILQKKHTTYERLSSILSMLGLSNRQKALALFRANDIEGFNKLMHPLMEIKE